MLSDLMPGTKRPFRLRMFDPELLQAFVCDDMHSPALSPRDRRSPTPKFSVLLTIVNLVSSGSRAKDPRDVWSWVGWNRPEGRCAPTRFAVQRRPESDPSQRRRRLGARSLRYRPKPECDRSASGEENDCLSRSVEFRSLGGCRAVQFY